MANNRGSITIFLALLLSGITLLICALIESARVISSKTQGQEFAYVAADGCFSRYAKEVFEEYGILCLWKSADEAKEDFVYLLNQSVDSAKDMFGLNLSACETLHVSHMTEQNGELFARQVDELMKYKLGEDIVSAILEKLQGIHINTKLKEFLDNMYGCTDAIETLESYVEIIGENINGIKESIREVEILKEEINRQLQEILEYTGGESGLQKKKDLYAEKVERLKYYLQDLNDTIRKNEDYEKLYVEHTQTAERVTENLAKLLEENREDFNDEIYESFDKQVVELKEKVSDKDTDYYRVYHCIGKKPEIEKYVQELETQMEMMNRAIKEDTYSPAQKINTAISDLEDYAVNYAVEKVEKVKKSVISTIKDFISDGMLSLVIADENRISDQQIETEELPSKSAVYTKSYSYRNINSRNETIRKVLFSQYVFDYFSDYVNKQEGNALQYQIEYILKGAESDRKNLEEVVEDLVCIREGFNLAYLLTDKEKCAQAQAMAAGIVGFTGITPLITVTKMMILGVWATAESVIDVRQLLEGEKLPLLKNRDTWNTSLSSLDTFHKTQYTSKKEENGLNYRDYLRVLLISQNRVVQVYRTMDVIQMKMQEAYNENFQLQDCIGEIKYRCTYGVKQLFGMLYTGKKKYEFDVEQTYSY